MQDPDSIALLHFDCDSQSFMDIFRSSNVYISVDIN